MRIIKNIYKKISALALVLCLLLCACDINRLLNNTDKGEYAGLLCVRYVDVGQANCSIITFPDGKNMIIDGGDVATKEDVGEYIKSLGITNFDYMVATHPHADHIGGLDEILDNFSVKTLYMPQISENDMPTTRVYENFITAISKNGCDVIRAKSDVQIYSDDNLCVECLAPYGTDYGNLNNYSAVIKITYGNTSFLFTGDSEKEPEEELCEKSDNLSSTVLLVGHHGSSTATTKEFLDAVDPEYAVISVGKDNSYGHPSSTVLNRLEEKEITVYRTDTDGTVTAVSDAKTVQFK